MGEESSLTDYEQGRIQGAEEERLRCQKELRDSLDYLDWIKILSEAIENRKTSWNENPVREWRNASDEILFAVKRAFEKKNCIPNQWAHLREGFRCSKAEKEARKK